MKDKCAGQKDMITDGWYTAYPVTETIYRISDNSHDNMYLIIGNEKAMLFDTGYGIGDLPAFLKRLTLLPLIAANTHGHFDHANGNNQFDYVYAGFGDMKLFSFADISEKQEYVQKSRLLVDDTAPLPFRNIWGTPAYKETFVIEDGMRFDLGGEMITAYLTPGHSNGSICFLAGNAGVLFAGDSYVPLEYWGPIWMHLENNAPLIAYVNSISNFVKAGGFDFMLSGHGECGLLPANRLNSLIDGINDIIDGKAAGEPENTLLGPGLRKDWDNVGIIYDPAKIY